MLRFCHYVLAFSLTVAAGLWPNPLSAGKADDTLVWSTDRDINIIDPVYLNARENIILGHHIMDTLVIVDPNDGEIKPLLATRWTWVNDTTLDFDLRTDAKFHSGKPLDADDVVYTLNFLIKPEHAVIGYSLLTWIKQAERIDAYKVRLNFAQPFPAALAYLASLGFIMEKGHYDKAPVKADGKRDWGAVPPNGTGPYRVAEFKPGNYVHLKRNPDYFKGGYKGQPTIENIRFRTIKEENTRLAEFMLGKVDWIWDVPKEQAERMAGNPSIVIKNFKTLRIAYLAFDVLGRSPQKFFTDKRVRMAVLHAINRESIAKNLVGPSSVVIHSACHPDQFGCSDDAPVYDYNPTKAKALLAEAGYPSGFEFDLYAYRERMFTEAIIGDLARVGIRAKLNFIQLAALLDLNHQGRIPAHNSSWGSNSIPDVSVTAGQFFSGGADDMARDPEVIAMITEANSQTDPARRKQMTAKVLAKIQAEAYWVPLFTYAKYYVWSKALDFEPTSDELPRFFHARWK